MVTPESTVHFSCSAAAQGASCPAGPFSGAFSWVQCSEQGQGSALRRQLTRRCSGTILQQKPLLRRPQAPGFATGEGLSKPGVWLLRGRLWAQIHSAWYFVATHACDAQASQRGLAGKGLALLRALGQRVVATGRGSLPAGLGGLGACALHHHGPPTNIAERCLQQRPTKAQASRPRGLRSRPRRSARPRRGAPAGPVNSNGRGRARPCKAQKTRVCHHYVRSRGACARARRSVGRSGRQFVVRVTGKSRRRQRELGTRRLCTPGRLSHGTGAQPSEWPRSCRARGRAGDGAF